MTEPALIELRGASVRFGVRTAVHPLDLRLAAGISHEVVFLEAGEVVEKGEASRIFTAPERERTQRFIATLTSETQSVALR